MGLNYGWEKLFLACDFAVGSTDTPQKRLQNIACFDIINLRREDLPSHDSWERLQKVRRACTSKPANGDEGTIAATTSQMSDDEATKWLKEILSLFNEVAEEYGRQRDLVR